MIRHPPISPLFPPPPLSRSVPAVEPASLGQVPRGHDRRPGLSPYRVCRREARVDRARQRRRALGDERRPASRDRKSTRLNSSHLVISYAVFCLKKKKIIKQL